jgi:hypothetical protein
MSYQSPESPKVLAESWLKRLREAQFAHYEAAEVLSRTHTRLGLPVVILSTVVGSSVFASIAADKVVPIIVKIVVGLISVAAAVLASLQTFLKLSERAEKHRAVAARYGAIRREVEQVLVFKEIEPKTLDGIRSQIDALSGEAPEIPKRIFGRVEAYLERHDKPDSAGSVA